MSTPIEELIKEIAATHAISVGRDDPIMVLHTINKRLLLDSYNVQQELLKRFEENLEAAAQRWRDDSKTRAERILNAALTSSRQTIDEATTSGARAVAEAVRKEIQSDANVVNGAVSNLRWLIMGNLFASTVALGASLLALSDKL
ncbi:conjugal transfer protein TraM [Methyloterricola oryzae]|uniref:conjugal transfer protein TraM n=1 Tax=Methyloterricola oryzae TaxID=1495050 RepID=UPI0005EB1FCD|nr:conjugal transfer protein TraM [Methyloterricola oryzae]